jgi:7-carboxy-7-deazaguanine synthase
MIQTVGMLMSRLENGQPEVFASIQGEGISAGVPSVFVRLAECNLKCDFCDTRYTWDWTQYDKTKETAEVTEDSVLARVLELAGATTRNVVITGGEPMLQQHHLVEIIRSLRDRGFDVEIETNGAIEPEPALIDLVSRWNVSPKLENSGNKKSARLRTGPLTWFAAAPNATFKFVVATQSDLDEIREIVKQFAIPNGRVILMPEGQDPQTITSRGAWLAELAATQGFRFSTRLHVLLWGGTERGR